MHHVQCDIWISHVAELHSSWVREMFSAVDCADGCVPPFLAGTWFPRAENHPPPCGTDKNISYVTVWSELRCGRTFIHCHISGFLTDPLQLLISGEDLRGASSSFSSPVFVSSVNMRSSVFGASGDVSIVCKSQLQSLYLAQRRPSIVSRSFFCRHFYSCSPLSSLLVFSWHLHLAQETGITLSFE